MTTEQVRSAHRRYWQLPAFVGGLCAAVAAYAYFPVRPADPVTSVRRSADELRTALAKKTLSASQVESLTRELESAAGTVPGSETEWAFLAGSGHIALAEHGPAETAPIHWKTAEKLLAPLDPIALTGPNDGARLTIRRAKVNAVLGTGDPAEIVRALSTPLADEDLKEKSRYIAEACLRMTPPDYGRAKKELAAYLGGPHALGPADAARFRLRLGDLYLRESQFAEARPYLTKAAEPAAPDDVRAAALVALGRIALAEDNGAEAEKLFADAVRTNAVPKEQLPLIRFQAAGASARLNHAAEAMAGYKAAAAADGPIGIAAQVRLAEMLTRAGNRAEAIECLERAVAGVTPASPFANPFLRVEQVQAAFEELIAVGLAEKDDEVSLRAATAYQSVAAADRGREKKADVYLAKAARLVPMAAKDPQAHAAVAAAYREAAREFDALAELLPAAAGKADALAKSAAALKAVGDLPAARAKLEAITALPGLANSAKASALLDAAEVAKLSGDPSAAKVSLQKAIDAGGPGGFHARVKLAAMLRDESNIVLTAATATPEDKARAESTALFAGQLLEQVADAQAVTDAEKPAHEQALFDLGWAMLKQGRTTDAEARFRKLLQLYPTTKDGPTARLCLAGALLAQVEKSGNPADPKLAEALKVLEAVAESGDKAMQTQARLRVARAYLGVGKYDQAVSTATVLADATKGTCDELIALSMVYLGYAKQEKWPQAAVIESRMRSVYKDLPDAAFAGGPPEYTRQYWTTNWFEFLDKARAKSSGDIRQVGGTGAIRK